MPAEPTQHVAVRRATRTQDALRLLFTLDSAGSPTTAHAPSDAIAVLHSQMKLQALDFWMRNPDYLANELLTEYEATRDTSNIQAARAILNSDEPDIRRYPMVRYLYGAYEPLDDALALLKARELIDIKRQGNPAQGLVTEHIYYLLRQGRNVIYQILNDHPELSWYANRARLVSQVAGNLSGSQLKERQYKQIAYAQTTQGSKIASITEHVRQRLQALTQA